MKVVGSFIELIEELIFLFLFYSLVLFYFVIIVNGWRMEWVIISICVSIVLVIKFLSC